MFNFLIFQEQSNKFSIENFIKFYDVKLYYFFGVINSFPFHVKNLLLKKSHNKAKLLSLKSSKSSSYKGSK